MPVLALVCAAVVVGVEQTIQWKYGTTGAVGLLLLSIGIKVKSPAISSVGAVVLALVATGPAVSS
ncbi:hypothetical protein ACIBVL_38535 [Streptomyces sp. NPDC049687]|uniref:hypothetical protein n=1 Tax=Streptomyces sp. NPDC049687 TaxID=3365596 RepID=UPI0037AACEAB